MKGKKLFTTLIISTFLLTGCTFGKKDVIIKVNGEGITQSQFNENFDKAVQNPMFAQMGGANVKKDKNSFMYLLLEDKVTNDLIVKTLINQEMTKRKITVTKDDVNKEIKQMMDKVGSKEKFDEILKQNGVSSEQFKSQMEELVKMKKLVNSISAVNITEADAKKFYSKNTSKFTYPDKVRASHILISANPEELKQEIMSDPANKTLSKSEVQAKIDAKIAEKLAKAKKVLAEVKKNPADFAKIAKENSDDPSSAKQGGDLGFFAKQDMVEQFSKVAFAQKPNTISDIVKTPYGFHIIMATDRMKAGQEPFVKVKNEIHDYLEQQAQVKVLEKLVESLKKQAKIEYVNPEFDPAKIQAKIKAMPKNAGLPTPGQAPAPAQK